MPTIRRLAATAALSALPFAAPSCLIIDEDYDRPFDIDPPTQLWQVMHDTVDAEGRGWVERCLDFGGQPVTYGDVRFCAATDY